MDSRFFACLYEPDDLVELRLLPSKRRSYKRVADLPELADELRQLNERGEHVFISANPRRREGGKAADVALARTLFVDIDHATVEDALRRVRSAGLPEPTVIVDSGHGTHCYWRLTEPVTDPAVWTKAQKHLIGLLGGDKVVCDLPRVMRLPGYRNHKEPAADCTVVDADASRVYALAELVPVDDAPVGDYWLARALKRAVVGTRNTTGAWLAQQLRDSGLAEAAALEAMQRYAAGVPGDGYTADEALASCRSAYTRPAREPAAGVVPNDDAFPPLYRPDVVAELFRASLSDLRYWRGEFYRYAGTHYLAVSEGELTARLTKYIGDVELWARPARKLADGWEDRAVPHPDHGGLMVVLHRIVPTTANVREIVLQLKGRFVPDAGEPPTWLDDASHPPADELLPCRNWIVHLPTWRMHPHTPELFALNALDYNYEASAPAPAEWLGFMHDLFGDDAEAVDTLQELFGYFLLPDTRQHKIAMFVGPRRSGKGTVGRVLTALLGPSNVCAPTLASLSTNFGLWPLLHKRLAIIGDARLSGRTDQQAVVERLLSISGEDSLTVDRKYLAAWSGRLPTRFLILTNELPRLSDASGAMASRFILLNLTRSWYGNEDHELTGRLLGELPGILNWAIVGWQRLQERGHFVQPQSSADALRELEDLSSPIRAFVRERCDVGPGQRIEVSALYERWREWCTSTGRSHPGNIQAFGRDVRSAFPDLRVIRSRDDDGRFRAYAGISCR